MEPKSTPFSPFNFARVSLTTLSDATMSVTSSGLLEFMMPKLTGSGSSSLSVSSIDSSLIVNLYRLILTSVLVTSKMFNDSYFTNQYVGESGGVTLQNINQLESFFMVMIDWELFITEKDFEFYDSSLIDYYKYEQAALFHQA